ncbi:MAG: MoaD/ThiS family protein [Actinomycetota bacterium]
MIKESRLVSVRYFAGAAAAAGADEEKVELPAGATVADLVTHLAGTHPRLAPVLDVASLLLDEVTVRDRTVVVPDGATVDVLPPFAGG